MDSDKRLSFKGIKTNSVYERTNLVTINNMARPDEEAAEELSSANAPEFMELVESILAARLEGKPVIWSMGAHVIKNGLSRYIIELVRNGFLTHVSGNGATSIHDFELAFLGETSEDVARSIEDGSFGMWEETGRYMNEAIQMGAEAGLGYGESLYRYLSANPEKFPHYKDCVFVQCQQYGIPYTCHISIGTDIIHQHPIVNFAALGKASGVDFHRMCQSIAGLKDGGVFLNFGSAISGPEIFLKGLSLARNHGLPMSGIIAANFDIVPVTAKERPEPSDPNYHYRPRRVFVDRLSEIDGKGYLFHGLHQQTIPVLFHSLMRRKKELGLEFPAHVEPVETSGASGNIGIGEISGSSRTNGGIGISEGAGNHENIGTSEVRETSRTNGMIETDDNFETNAIIKESNGIDENNSTRKTVLYPLHSRNSRLQVSQSEALLPPEGKLDLRATWEPPQLEEFIQRLLTAKEQGKRILVSIGGNMIGSGVNRYLIDLIKRGYISHLALNGAACFQDVELAVSGQAEELEDGYLREGKLGMWEEAAGIIHHALEAGRNESRGYGESLTDYTRKHPKQFPYLEESLLGACGRYGIPYTCHITVGTDDIQLHPKSDLALQAGASGYDFQAYCYTVAHLEGGVFMNFGSAVTGPEVFLKALSIARNLQYAVHHITTANFDIIRLGDYSQKIGYGDWEYYYRPRKNIVHRPTSLGGKGFHLEGLHQETIPAIWHALGVAEQAKGSE
ncbi:hypothetical protein [Paenibacillus agricola]|uniref:hypothetical protein n=1 Tax=Paenibacillus agricola TaxID=2716264 RepID=UPI001A9E0A48|nr:hypothetical protein [Paenibacillus agricola]